MNNPEFEIQPQNEPASEEPENNIYSPWQTTGLGCIIGLAFFFAQVVVILAFGIVIASGQTEIDVPGLTQALLSNGLMLALAVFASSIVCTGLILLLIKVGRNASFFRYLELRPIRIRTFLLLLVVTFAFVAAENLVAGWMKNGSDMHFFEEAYRNIASPVLLWLAVVIVGPWFEEIFFRGFLFVGLRRSRIGLTGTILVTSLTWAGLHAGEYGIFNLTVIFVIGILFGFVREKTHSLWAPLFMHIVFNLLAMIQVALTVSGTLS